MDALLPELIKSGPFALAFAAVLWLYVKQKTTYQSMVGDVVVLVKTKAISDQQVKAALDETSRAIAGVDRRLEDLRGEMVALRNEVIRLRDHVDHHRDDDMTGPIRALPRRD